MSRVDRADVDGLGALRVRLSQASDLHEVTRHSAVPAMGGSPLSASDLQAVAAYVWALGHQGQ